MKHLAIAASAASLLVMTSLPVAAQEIDPEEYHFQALDKRAVFASRLGWSVTGGLMLLEYPFDLPSIPVPMASILMLSSLGYGAGHFYAGDPVRGTFVSFGGPVATLGAGLACQAVYQLVVPPCTSYLCAGQGNIFPFLIGWLVGNAMYGAWVSTDAYHTALKQSTPLGPLSRDPHRPD